MAASKAKLNNMKRVAADRAATPPYYETPSKTTGATGMTKATTEQVGGAHYLTRNLQPLEMVYQNYGLKGLEAAVFVKVNKYFRDKDGLQKKVEDCRKAQHVLRIFEEKMLAELQAELLEESRGRNR